VAWGEAGGDTGGEVVKFQVLIMRHTDSQPNSRLLPALSLPSVYQTSRTSYCLAALSPRPPVKNIDHPTIGIMKFDVLEMNLKGR
jgi:hypothetical protein